MPFMFLKHNSNQKKSVYLENLKPDKHVQTFDSADISCYTRICISSEPSGEFTSGFPQAACHQ
jgi:hypothetical protein